MIKLCWIAACFFTLTLTAQERLVLLGSSTDKYVLHKVANNENVQMISNLFGIPVSKVAAYNHIASTASLAVGTTLKIPILLTNLLQQQNDHCTPVYHTIQKGENLYRLSKVYNQVPITLLREWNDLKDEVVNEGKLIIVGFLMHMPEKQAGFTYGAKKTPEIFPSIYSTGAAINAEKPKISKTSSLTIPTAILEPEKVRKPVEEVTKLVEEVKKPIEEVKKPIKVPAPISEVMIIPEPQKILKPLIKKAESSADYIPMEGDEGYFAKQYSVHQKEQTLQFRSGDAATFKTISGWADRKFYVLMDEVAPRTIVRITGSVNKSICAMVLGPLQETKTGTGLLVRISNAAAKALGFGSSKFTITLSYYE